MKPATFTQHPRPAYYDCSPGGVPEAMGCSIRKSRTRYTEWRDWKAGAVIACELYAHPSDEQELTNAIDRPDLAEAQPEAAKLLAKNFPPAKP